MNKILIADDHRMFNDAISELLKPVFQVMRVYDGAELLHVLQKEKPDLIMLDINLPRLNGLEAAARIRRDFPDVKILIVSMYNQQWMVKKAKEMGLEGYVLKDSSSETLLSGIDAVLRGEHYYESSVLKREQIKDAFANKWMITHRERQIIKELVAGKKAEEIAKQLGLAYETIKTHRKNIYCKLEINNIAGLMRFVNENDI